MSSPSIFWKAIIGASIGVGIYAVILGLLLTPSIQRFALYANAFNTLFLDNLNDPRKFGFAKNQITPFLIPTPDGEQLFAWHILPVDTYTRHENELRQQDIPDAPLSDVSSSLAFKLLRWNEQDPPRVVISFHGNAGHIAQGWRAASLRQLASLPNTHIVTIDYRGFGNSTGSPTERGLIMDGTALVNWLLEVAQIPPERIVILGQSLGTAVASAVSLGFVDPENKLIPQSTTEEDMLVSNSPWSAPTTFAGVVLVAPFSSLPSLMLTYRIGGVLPILLPLRPFPALAGLLTSQMVDLWRTADRLAAYYSALDGSSKLRGLSGRSMGSLQLIHALNDRDISYHQTELICLRIMGAEEKCIDGLEGPSVVEFTSPERVQMRFEILEFGGHNGVVTFTTVTSAVERAFKDLL